MNTLVVNCFAGPGAGKTTCAWAVAAELKKKGINCEYVPEYPKELVWEENYELLKDQEHIFEEEAKRLGRLRGKVEVIVTDAPILLNHIYGENNSPEFTERIDAEYDKYYNFNLFVERDTSHYQQEGRIQNLKESIDVDNRIKDMIEAKHLYCGTYSHENTKYIADNIIRNLEKIRDKPPIEIKAESTISAASAFDGLYGKEVNRGYYITDKISIGGAAFALGFNPEAPSPYVTWRCNNGEYGLGHYFDGKFDAKADLIKRAVENDEELDGNIHIEQKSRAIKDELGKNFDKEAFMRGVERAAENGEELSDEDIDLYRELSVEYSAAQENAYTDDMDMEL